MKRTLAKETINKIGEEVLLKGWVNVRRNLGKIIFIDLRDHSGIVQVVFASEDKKLMESANTLRGEFVIAARGKVIERSEKTKNPKIETGNVEIEAMDLEIINPSETPPFETDKDTREINEEMRLKYRYLDLRSARMGVNLKLRDRILDFMQRWMRAYGFVEIETPILTKGTPEGAREYIVPSRLRPGRFYVLPQSPQQFKQLLMVAGLERYFQIARCFRDEDLRGDRQPEFTQLDVEMSFVEQDEVLSLIEQMFVDLVREALPNKKISQIPFPRLTYEESMKKYGTDKPDLRQDKNNPDELSFCWVTDFPLFEYSETEKKLTAMHHPFTSPRAEDIKLLEKEPLKVKANAYDIVLNGYEMGGGSVRIHKRDLQNKIFQILGLDDKEIEQRFGHMLLAFTYGAPPHAGIALGLDRVVMLFANEPSVREVIAFPKTGEAECPLMGAPSELPEEKLKEVHIAVKNLKI